MPISLIWIIIPMIINYKVVDVSWSLDITYCSIRNYSIISCATITDKSNFPQ